MRYANLRLHTFRQVRQDPGGLLGIQLRQDEGDRLRVLVGDERGNLLGRYVLEDVEP